MDRLMLAARLHVVFWNSPLWGAARRIRDLLIGKYDEQNEKSFWYFVDEECHARGLDQ